MINLKKTSEVTTVAADFWAELTRYIYFVQEVHLTGSPTYRVHALVHTVCVSHDGFYRNRFITKCPFEIDKFIETSVFMHLIQVVLLCFVLLLPDQ